MTAIGRPCRNMVCAVGKASNGKCSLRDSLENPTIGGPANLPDDRERAVGILGPGCAEMDLVTKDFKAIVDGARQKGFLK